MDYYMGVDIGTTAVKVAAFTSQGELLSQESRSYEMLHPEPDQSEQDPDEIFNAVIESINRVYNALAPAKPLFVSFSAAMHSLIAVNENGLPLTNCIIWADNRAIADAEHIKDTAKGKEFYHATGVPLHAMSPFCKLLWLKENDPRLFQKTYKFIGIKEYIFFNLFGEFVIDVSVASATGLFNLRTQQWDNQVLAYAGIGQEKLSRLAGIRETFKWDRTGIAATSLLLPGDTIFVIGGSDGALANLSTGPDYKHKMVVTIGTSSAIRIITNSLHTDRDMRTFCYFIQENEFITGGASNNGAVVLEWLKNKLLESGGDMEDFLQSADSVPPGNDNLLFLPYILGERAPLWDAHAKGVFFGLTMEHTKAHMIRAAIEGVIYCIYNIGKVLLEKNPVTEIYATGGFSRNAMWVQILADVFNKKVVLSGALESSAWGAVVVGLTALDKTVPQTGKAKSVYTPDTTRHLKYMEQFRKFERITALLKNEFKNTGV